MNEWNIWTKFADAIALHACNNDSLIVECTKQCVEFYKSTNNINGLHRCDRLYVFMQLCVEAPEEMAKCSEEINLIMSALLPSDYNHSTDMYSIGKKMYNWLYDNKPDILGEYYVP